MKQHPGHSKKRPSDASSIGLAEKGVDVQTLLKHFPVMAADKLEHLAAEMSVVRFKRGERIPIDHRSADTCLVLKGAIAVTWKHDSRHQVLVTLLAPGEVLGISSLLPEMAKGLKGYAFTNSLVATINSTKLVDILLGVDTRAAFKSAMEMTVRWSSEALMRYIRMFRLSPRDRLVIALIEIGAKFGVRDSRGLIVNLPITQKDLANLLGVSRQKVNSDLGRFVRLGAVINVGRQLVLVPDKLFAMLDDPGVRYQTASSTHSGARLHNGSAQSHREMHA